MKAILYTLSLAFLIALSPAETLAQGACGSIIGSDVLGTDTFIIQDCNNPFGVTMDPPNPYTLRIDGQDVQPNTTIVLPDGRAEDISYTGARQLTYVQTELFRHVNGNYERVDLQPAEPTIEDFETLAHTYFATQPERDRYLEIVLYNFEHSDLDSFFYDPDTGEAIIDEVTGETVESRYFSFYDAFEGWFDYSPPAVEAGTYTMLFHESSLELVQEGERSLLESIKDFLVPTAYAECQVCAQPNIYTITFTIAEAPTGASSILFLPGIMGSHLYEESSECFGFGEQRRWFSHTDCDQLRLLTNLDGSSINDIYTKFNDEAVVDKASKFGITLEELYTNFIAEMNQLEEDQTIKDFIPFAYDWRLRLDHIIRSKKDSDSDRVRYVPGTSLQDGVLYQTLLQMAEDSHSGKVTIVSHSNGGLVAKAFMAELAETNDPLEAKIDNLILIGSPQGGTPDAINGVLHGTEIGPGGIIVNQGTTRKLLNTAPFGHHLLPNQYYFDGEGVSVDTPVINFREGLVTNMWRIQYGESIDSFEELKRFLDDSSGRQKPAQDDLKTPEVVQGALLNYAEEIGDKLANWEPPNTLIVHQLGGSGIWTPSRVEYSSNEYCLRSVPIGFVCDAYTGVLENELHFVMDGDGTVVLSSALAMSENETIKRWWLDINEYNSELQMNNVHKDMLEVPEVATFVSDIAKSTPNSYRFIGMNPPPVPQDIRLLFHLHSPLDMYVTSDQGTVSSTTNDISGAFYRRYGEVQYISLPQNVTNATLHMIGYEAGSYTLFKELWEGETEVSSVDFKALPTNTGTIVALPISFDEAGIMSVDFDGDGEVDGTVSESEDIIKASTNELPVEEVIKEKYGNSGTRIAGNPNPQVAGIASLSEEEQLKRIIELLQRIIDLLKRHHNL